MPEQEETKERIPLWIYPRTLSLVDQLIRYDNCKNRSEAIEKSVKFYYGYRFAKENTQFISDSLSSVLQSTVADSEQHIVRMLFKLAVELNMMMHVIAATTDVDEETLRRLRKKCVDDVKKTRGSISLDDAVEFQRG